MKSNELTQVYKAFLEMEYEELDQQITHFEEMVRIYKEKRNIIANTINAIDNEE